MNTSASIVCPKCGGSVIEGRGCVVAVQPFERPEPPVLPTAPGARRLVRVVEYKYRCDECQREFSTIEEF